MSWQNMSNSSTSYIPSSKWEGKKINCIGTSITSGAGGSKTYVGYLQDFMKFSAARNYGISGSTVSEKANAFYKRVPNMDADADIITVEGGTNDLSLNAVLGTLYTLDVNNQKVATTDTNTFYGAYHRLAKDLIAKYPTKKIVLLTPLHRGSYAGQPTDFQPNTNGDYIRDFVDAVIEIGKWYGFPVCDLHTLSNMQPNEPAQRNLYFTDQLHPNDLGHQKFARTTHAYLDTLPTS